MRTIIFDFDGTIADTFALIIRIFEEIVRSNVPVDQAELDRLRKIGLSAKWAQELGIPLWKAPFLLARGRRSMRRRMHNIEVFKGLEPVFRQLHDDNDVVLIVMSSNNRNTINRFLAAKGLDVYFTQVMGGVGLFKKAHVLKQIVKRNNLVAHDTIYVGDEVRDVEAAKKAGIKAVAVSWGFNDYSLLEKHEPDAIARTPLELANILGAKPESPVSNIDSQQS